MLSNEAWHNDLDPEKQAVSQAELLGKLFGDLRLDDAELDNFLRNVRRVADELIAGYGGVNA